MDLQKAREVLGVGPDADERAVRRAYRALLFDLEDNGQSDPAYPQKKEELQQAFEACLADTKGRVSVTGAAQTEAEAPASSKKAWLRIGVPIVIVLVVVRGYMWYQEWSSDIEGEAPVDTKDMIAAIEVKPGGSQVVAFRADGSKIESDGFKDGTLDQDIAWRPDGGRLLFSSNRGNGNYNIWRWNPVDNKVAIRSVGDRAKSNIFFGWTEDKALRDSALFTAGGFVFKYDQKKTTTEQLLPPATRKTQGGGEDQGNVSQMDAIYKQIGEGFVSAKWGIDRQAVWTVMKREADQVLVFNPLLSNRNKGLPKPYFAAKQIDFDVLPDGSAIASLHGFQFMDPSNIDPKYLKDGKPQAPFDDAIYFLPADGEKPPAVICHTIGGKFFFGGVGQQPTPVETIKDGVFALSNPAASPDGGSFAFVLGRSTGGPVQGLALIAFPLKEGGALKGPGRIGLGDVSQPSWSPEGDRITYVKREAGQRAIYVAKLAGGVEEKVSSGGDYMSPKFSPQIQAVAKPAQ
ncbi:MAG: PD40 domain-containing protein [Armatimonadetes bacterium]|nr:PD40 domain-containing protein [Armatimonadota bacterium]